MHEATGKNSVGFGRDPGLEYCVGVGVRKGWGIHCQRDGRGATHDCKWSCVHFRGRGGERSCKGMMLLTTRPKDKVASDLI